MFKGFRSMERIGGSDKLDGFRQKQGVYTNLPRFGPPEGKDLHPACLILYCLYSWRCYNGARCNLVEVEGDGVASLCVGSMRNLVSMRVSLCEFSRLGGALGGFIYAAS
jgi:hypothetical protein